MFIEKLKISTKDETIREMNFHKGMNLIIDNTPLTADLKSTGNNVGKTTVLKLIYFVWAEKVKIFTQMKKIKIKCMKMLKTF